MGKKQAKRNVDKDLFVEEYCANGGNGVQAVIAAGFAGTYNAARVAAHRLLTNVNIAETIAKKKAQIARIAEDKLDITVERQLKKYDEVREAALAKGQLNAANHALDSQTRMAGLFEPDNRQRGDRLGLVEAIKLMQAQQRRMLDSGPKLIESKPVDDCTENAK